MTGWQTVAIEEIAAPTPNALSTGPFGSAISSKFFRDTGVPVIRGSNLSGELGVRLIDKRLVFIDQELADTFERSKVRQGDLVFTCWGTVDQVGLIDKRSRYSTYIISNKQMKLTPDPSKASSLFLYYTFSSPAFLDTIIAHAIGSSVPGFNLGQLRKMQITLPPLSEQIAIAEVLGTLDDKIEANRKLAATLEAMARALFKSWFVDFDPVRAKMEGRDPKLASDIAALFPDRLADSGTGDLPAGWSASKFGQFADPIMEIAKANELQGNETYIGLEHMPRQSITLDDWGVSDGLESHKARFRRGDTLFGKLRPYFHKVGRAMTDGVCSTDILVLRPKLPDYASLVLMAASSKEFVAFSDLSSTGTKMPRTNWARLADFDMPLPSHEVATAFDRLTRPLLERIEAGVFQSKSAGFLRDRLLPKLLSGKLRIADAERLAADAGA
ncbi:MAG: restriction endonuclease subunit S [Verrucomicrobiaceae bacterium]|nr:MAG: restriction endonuclease subunit S [Verrucomicrobiaceae bacterium]